MKTRTRYINKLEELGALVNQLSEKMEQPEFLHGLIRQMEVFADAVAQAARGHRGRLP